MKKISSGEISASSVSNGLSTGRSKSSRTTTTTTEEEGADPYGLLAYNDEETLQELVSQFVFVLRTFQTTVRRYGSI